MVETSPTDKTEQTSTSMTVAKEGKMGTASIWCDLNKLKTFRNTLKLQGTTSISQELNQFFDKRTAEIKGLVPNGSDSEANSIEAEVQRRQNYENAKRRTFDLQIEIAKMQKLFKEEKCWNEYLKAFCRAIDYDKAFDAPNIGYGYGSGSEKTYDDYCLRFIEEASDKETEFKEQSTRFLLRNKDIEFCFAWIGFVEKLKERRKLSRQMLMYHLDSLGPEQRLQLEKEEAERKEAIRLKREEEARVRAEREQKQREAEERAEADCMLDQEEEEEDEEDEPEDSEEEFEVMTNELQKGPEECRAIVPVGGEKTW